MTMNTEIVRDWIRARRSEWGPYANADLQKAMALLEECCAEIGRLKKIENTARAWQQQTRSKAFIERPDDTARIVDAILRGEGPSK